MSKLSKLCSCSGTTLLTTHGVRSRWESGVNSERRRLWQTTPGVRWQPGLRRVCLTRVPSRQAFRAVAQRPTDDRHSVFTALPAVSCLLLRRRPRRGIGLQLSALLAVVASPATPSDPPCQELDEEDPVSSDGVPDGGPDPGQETPVDESLMSDDDGESDDGQAPLVPGGVDESCRIASALRAWGRKLRLLAEAAQAALPQQRIMLRGLSLLLIAEGAAGTSASPAPPGTAHLTFELPSRRGYPLHLILQGCHAPGRPRPGAGIERTPLRLVCPCWGPLGPAGDAQAMHRVSCGVMQCLRVEDTGLVSIGPWAVGPGAGGQRLRASMRRLPRQPCQPRLLFGSRRAVPALGCLGRSSPALVAPVGWTSAGGWSGLTPVRAGATAPCCRTAPASSWNSPA